MGVWTQLFAAAQRIAPEGTLRWHALTWLGHSIVAAICVAIVSPLLLFGLDLRLYATCSAGGFYLLREVEQWLWGSRAPLYDSLGDVLAPWIVGLWLSRI